MSEMTAQLNMLRGSLIMEELYRLGIRDVCIAPGSRSTPLTLSAAEHSGLNTHVHFDERGLGFFALGIAKGSERPVALVCSSGTAAANFLPAVIEASKDHVPLIVLTADRPGELQNVSANQSIDQHRLFGSHAVLFRELHCPSESEPPEAVLTLIDELVMQSRRVDGGPVHINCMFREPFVPEQRLDAGSVASLQSWLASDQPYTPYLPTDLAGISAESLKEISVARGGLLIIGRLRSQDEVKSAEALAEHLQWPVFADVGSGLRLGTLKPWLIAHFDMLLEACELPEPDFILYVGGAFTSKRLLHYLKDAAHIPLYQVQGSAARNNPLHRPVSILTAELPVFVDAVRARTWPESALTEAWTSHEKTCKCLVEAEGVAAGTGAALSAVIARTVGDGQALYIGNSLSIRDMERYAPAEYGRPRVCINRGASGIDGNIATAAGFAAGINKPLTIFIGDLTALHDLNSLSLVRNSDQDTVVIIHNNNGGGIFHKLPVSRQTPYFEEFFVAPHGYQFSGVAAMFGFTYHAPGSLVEFESVYSDSQEGGLHLIEITTSR